MQNSALIEKIRNLPPDTVGEVEDFVDFLTEKRRASSKPERDQKLAAFAREYGGTALDLDEELETAALEFSEKRPPPRRQLSEGL